jgi:hypothetical protein
MREQSVRGYGAPMPEISRFFGIVITMYADDHGPPHFHARYGESQARIALADAEVLAGKLPPRALGMVVEWASMHRSGLERDLERATRRLTTGTHSAARLASIDA